jgi:hypothetical protein
MLASQSSLARVIVLGRIDKILLVLNNLATLGKEV